MEPGGTGAAERHGREEAERLVEALMPMALIQRPDDQLGWEATWCEEEAPGGPSTAALAEARRLLARQVRGRPREWGALSTDVSRYVVRARETAPSRPGNMVLSTDVSSARSGSACLRASVPAGQCACYI